eukprot:354311-Chlamydomonas_euryale.AAC.3
MPPSAALPVRSCMALLAVLAVMALLALLAVLAVLAVFASHLTFLLPDPAPSTPAFSSLCHVHGCVWGAQPQNPHASRHITRCGTHATLLNTRATLGNSRVTRVPHMSHVRPMCVAAYLICVCVCAKSSHAHRLLRRLSWTSMRTLQCGTATSRRTRCRCVPMSAMTCTGCGRNCPSWRHRWCDPFSHPSTP